MRQIKLLIVDDYQLIIDGIKVFLSRYDFLEIINEKCSAEEAIDFVKNNEVDIVLLDVNLPLMNGVDCTKELKKVKPEIKVLILSMLNEYQYIRGAMDNGASGYLLKNCLEEELVEAIERVQKGQTYYSQEVTDTILKSFQNKGGKKRTSNDPIPMTRREREVLQLILKEKSNSEIAEELFISLRTVETHKRNILEKTGSKNTAGLVLYAVANKLIDVEKVA